MKKIKLLCLSFLGLLIGFINFSSADKINFSVSSINYSNNDTGYINLDSGFIYCFYAGYNTSSRNVVINFQDFNGTLGTVQHTCFTPGDLSVEYIFNGTQFNQLNYYKLIDYVDLSDYVLESNVTENYCTNKFSNLIDESDITSSYCESVFDLIDPSDCPSSGSTGDIMWSSFWVNDRQVLGGENIYLYIPDWLDWSYTYIDQNLQVEVVNEGDQDYINDILTVQEYHPSNEDFMQAFIGGLTLILPYIVIILFIAFIWKFIKRIFK